MEGGAYFLDVGGLMGIEFKISLHQSMTSIEKEGETSELIMCFKEMHRFIKMTRPKASWASYWRICEDLGHGLPNLLYLNSYLLLTISFNMHTSHFINPTTFIFLNMYTCHLITRHLINYYRLPIFFGCMFQLTIRADREGKWPGVLVLKKIHFPSNDRVSHTTLYMKLTKENLEGWVAPNTITRCLY